MRRFVRTAISDREYIDTLSFLALIFIIYPLLPTGSYGPFEFFEPRKIWRFVILVSGVSYVGYFLTKFTGGERGALLTAIVGAIASTTAYTTGISRVVADSPEGAIPAGPLRANSQFDTVSADAAAGRSSQSDARDSSERRFRRDDACGIRRRHAARAGDEKTYLGRGFQFPQPVFDPPSARVWRGLYHRAAGDPRRQALCGIRRPDGGFGDQRIGGRRRDLADAGGLRAGRCRAPRATR